MMKSLGKIFLVSLISGAMTLGAYKMFFESENLRTSSNSIVNVAPQNFTKNVGLGAENIDFTNAADKAIHSVVHVKNVSYRTVSNPIMEFFYGYRGGQQQEQIGTGSGVIISEDGYVVTNNHVIKDAKEIEITLNNKKSYTAKLIGTDSKMDIALLKIDANEKLPYTTFADSDQVKVGEWVLAVGNPYNLNSTVTAGIVSAKARNLDTNGIQSFIQTDAAVNPGNSGGALVNTRGELVGINTMISSTTGSYVGYSFAVPSNITRKIIEDIMEFGNVQRGVLGIEGNELNGMISKELGLTQSEGFYIKKINSKSGASKSGLKEGDVIIKLDEQKISSIADVNSYINSKRPNDKVEVTFLRDEKLLKTSVVLSKNDVIETSLKGLKLEDLSNTDMKKFRTDYGVKINEIDNPRFKRYANELKGAVILKIDNIKIDNLDTVNQIIQNTTEDEGFQIDLITNRGQMIRMILD